jgi:lipoprotein-releasing system permease protein
MYILSIALRHLRSRSITWVATALIAVSVWLYLLVISVLEGFKEHYMDKLQSIHAHITVQVGEFAWGIQNPEAWAAAVSKADPGIRGVTIGLESPALAIFDTARTVGTMRGVDLEPELRTGRLKELLRPLELRETLRQFGLHERPGWNVPQPGCIVGGVWRKAYKLRVGDQVTFLLSDEDGFARSQPFYILGFFEGKNPYLETGAYVGRKTLAEMLKVQGMAKTLFVWLENPNRPDLKVVQSKIKDLMTEILRREDPKHVNALEVETWQQKDNEFYEAITRENVIMRFIMGVFLALLAFIFYLIFGRLVAEKVRDIGALRALGATRLGVCGCFLAQGLLVGLAGLALGLLISFFFIRNVNPIARWFGLDLFPNESFGVDKIPAVTLPYDVALISCLTVVAAVLGALLPAWWAARLNPVECLRHE